MNLLLGTHTFLWFSEDNPKLSRSAKSLIEDPSNGCFISIATIWEMAIKVSIGKLAMKVEFISLAEELRKRDFDILQISFEHTLRLTSLEFYHRDPFDRLLVAQALEEEFTLVSNEVLLDSYGIKRIW